MCSAAVTGKTGGVDRLAKTQALEQSGLPCRSELRRLRKKPRPLKGTGFARTYPIEGRSGFSR
jgi:hypothetical protein